MARSEKCLECKYCRLFDRSGNLQDWRNAWSCDYMIMTGKREDKGSDPNMCRLFEKKEAE